MSLQDVVVDKASRKEARVLFDNGSQMTLVKNSFCIEQGYPCQPQSYSIIGVRGNVQHYNAGEDGFLWTVPLVQMSGEVNTVQAFGVNQILRDKIG